MGTTKILKQKIHITKPYKQYKKWVNSKMQEDAKNYKKHQKNEHVPNMGLCKANGKNKNKNNHTNENGSMANNLNGELKCWREHIQDLLHIHGNKQNITIDTITEEAWTKIENKIQEQNIQI